MMARRMVVRKIDAPLEHIGVHGSGRTFMLAGDYLHPIATAESVVETHALERMGLAGAGARNACQSVPQNIPQIWEKVCTLPTTYDQVTGLIVPLMSTYAHL